MKALRHQKLLNQRQLLWVTPPRREGHATDAHQHDPVHQLVRHTLCWQQRPSYFKLGFWHLTNHYKPSPNGDPAVQPCYLTAVAACLKSDPPSFAHRGEVGYLILVHASSPKLKQRCVHFEWARVSLSCNLT